MKIELTSSIITGPTSSGPFEIRFSFLYQITKWHELYILRKSELTLSIITGATSSGTFEIRFSFSYQITKWYELYILRKSELTSSIITGPTGSGPICASASGFAIGDEKVWLTAKARVANATKAFKIR